MVPSSTVMAAPPNVALSCSNITTAPPTHEQYARPPKAVPIAPQPPAAQQQWKKHKQTCNITTVIAAKPSQPLPLQPCLQQQPKPPAFLLQQPNKSVLEKDAPQSKEDKDAGSMLLGFLKSLPKGFMEAKSSKDQENQELAAKQDADVPGSIVSTKLSSTTASTRESNDNLSGTIK